MNYLKKGLHAFTLRRLCMKSYGGARWRSVKAVWARTPLIARGRMALPLALGLGLASGLNRGAVHRRRAGGSAATRSAQARRLCWRTIPPRLGGHRPRQKAWRQQPSARSAAPPGCEKSSQKSTQKSSQKTIQKSSQKSTQKSTQKSRQKREKSTRYTLYRA